MMKKIGKKTGKREKAKWKDPVKDTSASPATLAIKGDFSKFTADMRRIFNAPKEEKREPTSSSASPGPGDSS